MSIFIFFLLGAKQTRLSANNYSRILTVALACRSGVTSHEKCKATDPDLYFLGLNRELRRNLSYRNQNIHEIHQCQPRHWLAPAMPLARQRNVELIVDGLPKHLAPHRDDVPRWCQRRAAYSCIDMPFFLDFCGKLDEIRTLPVA